MPKQDFSAVDPSASPYDELFATLAAKGTMLRTRIFATAAMVVAVSAHAGEEVLFGPVCCGYRSAIDVAGVESGVPTPDSRNPAQCPCECADALPLRLASR